MKKKKTKAISIYKENTEKIKVINPITGNKAIVPLSRAGTTDKKLAMIMLAPDATKEQKNSMVSQWLFEQGKENASFIAELFVSKGVHTKETQAFKKQIRWDFEMFADKIVGLFEDLAGDLRDPDTFSAIQNFADRLESGAKLIREQIEQIKEARMREKGFGVYIDKNGKAYSVFDDDIETAIKNDKQSIEEDETQTSKQTSKKENSKKDVNKGRKK